jgi:hypothetical protein
MLLNHSGFSGASGLPLLSMIDASNQGLDWPGFTGTQNLLSGSEAI